MRLRKTLAYGDGEASKPQKIRKLAYTLAFSLPLIAACHAHAVPARDTTPIEAAREAQEAPRTGKTGPACGTGLEGVLQPGENVLEAVCRFGREYVMTDASLLIVTRPSPTLTFDPIVLSMHASRTDMQQMREQGIADWEPSEDSVFILTKNDRTLTRLPNEGMGATVPAYTMPFDTSMLGSDSMVYYSGFLFIAPRGGEVTVFSFGEDVRSGTLPLRSRYDDAGFFMRQDKLIFGKAGLEETEIRVNGPEIKNIELIKRIK
jgi:hypothetical protein